MLPLWAEDLQISPGALTAWAAFITAVAGALTAAAIKLWPMLMRSKAQRAKLRQDQARAFADMERERLEAEGRLKREATGQAMDAMRGMFDRLESERKRDEERIEQLFGQVRGLQREHAECIANNERLSSAVDILKARVEAINVQQELLGVPTNQDAVIVADERGRILEWNQVATVLFHWSQEEARGMEVAEIIPQKYLAAHDSGWADCLQKRRPPKRGPYYWEARTKDGEIFPVEVRLSGWEEGGGARRFSAAIRRRVAMSGKDPMVMDLHALRLGADPQPPAGSVRATPTPEGGAVVRVPPGAQVDVTQDSLSVHVRGGGDDPYPEGEGGARPSPPLPEEPTPHSKGEPK